MSFVIGKTEEEVQVVQEVQEVQEEREGPGVSGCCKVEVAGLERSAWSSRKGGWSDGFAL